LKDTASRAPKPPKIQKIPRKVPDAAFRIQIFPEPKELPNDMGYATFLVRAQHAAPLLWAYVMPEKCRSYRALLNDLGQRALDRLLVKLQKADRALAVQVRRGLGAGPANNVP